MKNINCITDNDKCYFSIYSGTGGDESQYWTNILYKMYTKWLNKKKFKYNIILDNNSNFDKYKNKYILIYIEGNNIYKLLKNEIGIHRLVRKNPINKIRHTSFSSIYIFKNNNENIKNFFINKKDIKIEYCKSSGSGGQHVNKTNSAVKLTHVPTGLRCKCQNTRYQNINKNIAFKVLKNRILKFSNNLNNIKKNEKDSKSNITWGKQIRSYILDNSLIKDNRTGIKVSNIKHILNGNIDIFIYNNKKK